MGKHVQLLSMDHLRCPLPLAESWYVLQPRPHCPRWKVYVDDLPQNKKEPRCGHPSCGTRHDPPFFFLHRAASRRLSDPPDKESSLLRAGELFRMLLVLRTNEGEREREILRRLWCCFHWPWAIERRGVHSTLAMVLPRNNVKEDLYVKFVSTDDG